MSEDFRLERRPIHKTEKKPLNEQQKALERLLEEVYQIEHPDIPEALKGLIGMITADEILKEKGKTGILIGGLADQIWRKYNYPEALNEHKDVDVMVLSGKITRGEHNEWKKFLGGIDWWEPAALEKGTIWNNGHGITLMFGLEAKNPFLKSGLYLPNSECVVEMKISEAKYLAKQRGLAMDDDFINQYKSKELEHLNNPLFKNVESYFNGQILDSPSYIKDLSSIPDLHKFYTRK